MDRPSFIISLLSLLSVFLFILYSYLTADLAVKNIEYTILHNEIEKVKRENNFLHIEILTQSALWAISEKAKRDGFIDYEKVYSIR